MMKTILWERRHILLAVVLLCLTTFLLIRQTSNTSVGGLNNSLKISLNRPSTLELNISCVPGVPCEHPETVNFRIIVITFNRPESLQKLLKTLDTVVLDGDTGRLDIWIDRRKNGTVDSATVKVAEEFRWKHGPTRVHVQNKHAGIYGQWIDTWKPPSSSSGIPEELALILEDDISVSPYVYRWIKAVHVHYGKRKEFAGCSLTSDDLTSHAGSRPQLSAPQNHTVFMYKVFGTWGFSPAPGYWRKFQKWFHRVRLDANFRPYVPVQGLIITEWYKQAERSGTGDGLWSIWIDYFTYKEKLFTVYSNLKVHNNDNRSCLSINRREIGLHFHVKGHEDMCKLLIEWNNTFIEFPNVTLKLDFDGKPISVY